MDIRKAYLEYFKKNGHLVMPSSSLIPTDDPSVLLTTAGMQQFKPYYLGTKKPPNPRIATVQKCFRTSDIESVGYTDRHLTFFEMLGNFAFADYFKKEAIGFAVDFCLNEIHLPLDRLRVGVFAGDGSIPEDKEAIQLWESHGITLEHMYRFGKSENFWGPAGESGPCGPCTELYYDFGPDFACGNPECSPSCDCGRYLEIWNLVFTQYNYSNGQYMELPNKNIDTGMGLERIEAVIEKNPSVFKTTRFNPIISKIQQISGKKLSGKGEPGYSADTNRCIKIVADHSRAVSFLIADGVMPSNESRGYILRRIIRRAIRFGKLIDIEDYFLNEVAQTVISAYSDAYPELLNKKDTIKKIINDEERRFSQTLKEGTKVLSLKIEELKSKGKNFLDPEDSFKLYDTFGFPAELTIEILRENNLEMDMQAFNSQLKTHSEKSRVKTVFDKKVEMNLPLYKEIASNITVEFTGYQELKTISGIASIIRINGSIPDSEDIKIKVAPGAAQAEIVDKLSKGQQGEVLLYKSPFYGEKGGQIGDRGTISTDTGVFVVQDTKMPLEDFTVHSGFVSEGFISCGSSLPGLNITGKGSSIDDNLIDFKDKITIRQVKPSMTESGTKAVAQVDASFNKDISKNHTSTHILHWALRTVFGQEVTQAGSYVANDRFRFDYNINELPAPDSMDKVEKIVNEKIQRDNPVRIYETTKEYAAEIGAMSLFEEKYGKFVRVVEIGDYSRELCGGTHVSRTGEIGLIKIISDSSIGANIRRIEAVTGLTAFNFLNSNYKVLKEISENIDSDIFSASTKVESIRTELKKMQEDLLSMQVKAIKKEILDSNRVNAGLPAHIDLIGYDFTDSAYWPGIDSKTMGIIVDEIINEFQGRNTFLVFANIINGKPLVLLSASKDLFPRGINCSLIAKDVGRMLKGGGGGKPEFAQVGGSDSSRVREIIDFVKNKVLETLKT
jgi:alanyl-tRNA synthetase